MPDVKSTHLRIYCVCGQKMKVLEKMYGLPGKCIACRQKIRIPRRDQIPEGTTKIYLKDHPEFLRGSRRNADEAAKEKAAQKALDAARIRRETSDDPTPITELDLVDGTPTPQKTGTGATLPIDTLEPLQRLCSLQYKLARQLSTLDEYHHDDKALIAEVEGHLSRVGKLRTELDDHLHQLLMEVAIELTNTQEKIAQDRLSARVGEISFDKYQHRIYRLRSRRERLERRQLNLRGWLAVRDPYVAGGFLDLSIESMPEEGFKVTLPVEHDEGQPLLSRYVASLREALSRRVRAEQKLEQAERLAFQEGDEESLGAAQLECEVEKRMARAAVRFYLSRLKRLKKDFAGDIETVNAQMETARDRLKTDEIGRQQYDDIEQGLLRAKKDLAKARSVVSRALIANTSADLPHPGGTFLERLGFSSDKEITPDMWLGWLSALALSAALFLPLVGDASLLRALLEYQGLGSFAILVPIAVAIAVAIATRVSENVTRGFALLLIWAAGMSIMAYGLYQALHSLDPMAGRFRSGDSWMLRPGLWLMWVGLTGIAAAALAAFWPVRKLRIFALAVIALGILGAGLIPSDAGGVFAARPAVDIVMEDTLEGPEQTGSVHVTNLGRRELRLVSQRTDARGSYFFMIQQRVGADSWRGVSVAPSAGDEPEHSGVLHTIARGETRTIPFSLMPGEYRVLLLSEVVGTKPVEVEQFTIEGSEPFQEEPEMPPTPVEVAGIPGAIPVSIQETQPEVDSLPEPAVSRTSGLTVELKGVMTGPKGEARFSFVLRLPNGRENPMMLSLGENLWEDWDVSEFNPSFSTVTLQRGENLLILRRGERIDLPL